MPESSDFLFRRPQIPQHYYILAEPPDDKGEEVLRFVSDTRSVKIKGRAFRDFQLRVVPLLDGTRSFAEIADSVEDLFTRADLHTALLLLAQQNLLRDAAQVSLHAGNSTSREPQANFLHEISLQPEEAQRRLRETQIAMFGLGAVGASASLALAASGLGSMRLIDSLPVTAADPFLCDAFDSAAIGAGRAETLRARLERRAPDLETRVHDTALESEAEIAAAVEGCAFVVCCLDPGQISLAYKLNRVCLAAGTPWIACDSSASEVIVGPTVVPGETACHLCYKMRLVAASETPEDAFAVQSFLDRRKRDDSEHRQNLPFTTGLGAQLVALETFKQVTGILMPITRGRIVVFDTIQLRTSTHVVLRKPWCPACSPDRTHSRSVDDER